MRDTLKAGAKAVAKPLLKAAFRGAKYAAQKAGQRLEGEVEEAVERIAAGRSKHSVLGTIGIEVPGVLLRYEFRPFERLQVEVGLGIHTTIELTFIIPSARFGIRGRLIGDLARGGSLSATLKHAQIMIFGENNATSASLNSVYATAAYRAVSDGGFVGLVGVDGGIVIAARVVPFYALQLMVGKNF
jgi:hypothetical protein